MKRFVFILFVLLAGSSFAQETSIKEVFEDGSDPNIYDTEVFVLAEQQKTLTFTIKEPEDGIGYFQNIYDIEKDTLILYSPDFRLFNDNLSKISYSVNPVLGNSDIKYENGNNYTDYTEDYDSLYHFPPLDGVAYRDTIIIEDIQFKIPSTIEEYTEYELILNHNFIGTEGEDVLVTFRYTKPQISLSPATAGDDPDYPAPACYTDSVTCKLHVTPALGYSIYVDGEPSDTSFDESGYALLNLHYGQEVFVCDDNNNDEDGSCIPFGTSDTVKVEGTQFYDPIELDLLNSQNICPGEENEIDINYNETSFYNLMTVEYSSDGTSFTSLDEGDYEFGESYLSFKAKDNGYIRLKFNIIVSNEESSAEIEVFSDTLEYNNVLKMDTYALQHGIKIPSSQSSINMFFKLDPPFDSKEVDTLEISGIYETDPGEMEFYVKGITSDSIQDFTFGRFHFQYNGSNYANDGAIFDTNNENVTSGAANLNPVWFHYGKYFVEEDGKVCLDSTQTEIHVVDDPIFVPEESFCSYDDSTYTIYIDTTSIPSFDVHGDSTITVCEYLEYKITNAVAEVKGGADSILFVPSEWRTENEITAVEVFARARGTIYKNDSCPAEWSGDINGPIYEQGDWVSYLGREYECISAEGAYPDDIPGIANDVWDDRGACPQRCVEWGSGGELPLPESGDTVKIDTSQKYDGKHILPGECIRFVYLCLYEAWSEYGNMDYIYFAGQDTVTSNGIIYACIRNAYPTEKPGESDAWEELGPCQAGGDSTVVDYNYASTKFYIYQPKTDGAFLNLDENYCMTNQPVTFSSNYAIDTIIGHNDIVRNIDGLWEFTPEDVISEAGLVLDSSDFRLVYEDTHGCVDTTGIYRVYVSKDHEVMTGVKLQNLDTAYCESNTDFLLSSNYSIESLSGPGIRDESDNYLFNPGGILEEGYSDSLFNVGLIFRDPNGCKYDTTFRIVVHESPVAAFDFENLCIGDYTQFVGTSLVETDPDSLIRRWNFGDYMSLEQSSMGSNPVPGGTHGGYTTGTYIQPAHRYKNPGIYQVNLKVTTPDGCMDNHSDTLIIGEYPEVDFNAEGFTLGHPSYFTNYSTAAEFDTISYYVWQYDDASLNDTLTNASSVYNFNLAGVHEVNMQAVTVNGCMSDTVIKVPVFPQVVVDNFNPYHGSFNSGSLGWLAAHSFDKGLPSGWTLSTVEPPFAKYPNTEGQIWQTALPEDDIVNEKSWVESPCFILDNLDFPLLSVDIYQSIETGRDGAVVQYSLDDGASWHLLSSGNEELDKGLNWYNAGGIVSNPGDQVGTGNIGWSANTKSWTTTRFPLDQVKEAAIDSNAHCVRFRMAYSSDAGTAQGAELDGFAFDNFFITSRSRIVMLEQFVNVAQNKTLQESEETWLNKFVESHPVEVVDLRYHNYISHDYDPLFYINPPDISARSMEYGASMAQLTMVDGIYRCLAPAEDSVRAYYNMRTLNDKSFDINVQTSKMEGALHVKAEVTKLVDTLVYGEGSEKCVVRMAIVQKNYTYEDDVYKNVVVELLPTGEGNVVASIPAALAKGEKVVAEADWTPNVTTIGNEFRLVVYVQGIWGMDEVHQVWFSDLENELIPQLTVAPPEEELKEESVELKEEFELYPVPASQSLHIQWKEPLTANVEWQLVAGNGQLVKNGICNAGVMKTSIDVGNLQEGAYTLRFYDKKNESLQTKKILIIR